ncbi:MAG: glycosyltransferase family 4 protein [Phycisphaerae bacterium]|nr:glycosyltransferase family 4 protein [Phycisphaerae bacterium]
MRKPRRSLDLSERIRVILNDRVLFLPRTGVGHYVRQLLDALKAESGEVELHPFLSALLPPRRPEKASGGVDAEAGFSLRPPRKRTWLGRLRRVLQRPYRAAFRWQARKFRLYHEPNHIPIRCGVSTVTTIHDLSVLVHPEWHPADRVRWYEREFDAGLRQTCRFIAASEFTKHEMVARLGLSPERIDVTYQAARPAFTSRSGCVPRAVRARLELPDKFFLFVGTLEPRKNVAGLLVAYAALPQTLRRRFPLVIAGGWGWKIEALHELIASHGVQNETRLVGYLNDATLAALYAGCTAFVWPTLYEGFGLPPLEAMTCGGPVIVSNVTSLPEVVGDAGVMLDPHDVPAWSEAMRRMAEDAAWRQQWCRRGHERALTFTWQRCARQTIACYQAALQST